MNELKKLFKSSSIKSRSIFAVTQGTYLGELLVYLEKVNSSCYFLSLPLMQLREISSSDVEKGIDVKVLDFINQMPKPYFKVCYKQYKQIKSIKKPK